MELYGERVDENIGDRSAVPGATHRISNLEFWPPENEDTYLRRGKNPELREEHG